MELIIYMAVASLTKYKDIFVFVCITVSPSTV